VKQLYLAATGDKLQPRLATADDLSSIVETLALAFADDPVWRPSLTRPGAPPDGMVEFWSIWIRGALRYPWTWLLGQADAVSVWIPPSGTELSDEQEAEMRTLAEERLGRSGSRALELTFESFATSHPRSEPHFYLSLLGTHPRSRGQGLGMSLLASNLAVIDAEGVPSYLESSNPANDARYQRHGFRPITRFSAPAGGPVVTGMWRPVGGGS
jgi:GNAT superfamily N-acetyltransferase